MRLFLEIVAFVAMFGAIALNVWVHDGPIGQRGREARRKRWERLDALEASAPTSVEEPPIQTTGSVKRTVKPRQVRVAAVLLLAAVLVESVFVSSWWLWLIFLAIAGAIAFWYNRNLRRDS